MTTKIVRRAAATTALAAGLLAGLAGPAHADTASAAAVKPATMLSGTTTLAPGQQQLYSTWFWGSTQLCATNHGAFTGVLKVQSTSPAAGPEYLYISNGSTQCISRWWWGVPVWAINSGSTTLEVSSS